MTYSKEDVKDALELEDIFNLLEYLDAEPQMYGNYIVAKTICHSGETHKLYFYENTQLLRCYTGDCGTFDIFELIQKIQDVDLNKAIYFIVNFFNLQSKLNEVDEDFDIEDWKIFSRYNKLSQIEVKNDKVRLPQIHNYIEYYPQPRLLNWERENISYEVCQYMGIKYNPVNGSIIIPHKDQDGRLVGIRQRTLVKEDEIYGKYRPARLWYSKENNFKGQLCNHPLGFNLYGLYEAKDNIKDMQTAIVVESEKSVLQYISYFGTKSNICVAVCGNSLSKYQFQLLLECGIKELVIGFDKDFENFNDDSYKEVEKRLLKMYNKFNPYVNVSFLFDKENNILQTKMSPLDAGKEKFLQLWRNRVVL